MKENRVTRKGNDNNNRSSKKQKNTKFAKYKLTQLPLGFPELRGFFLESRNI